ncbi:MAG: deoxyribonuclease IV [Candidatus Zixiibacteriota bacterium]|nr:MAG: deoxyribonuclease IV [candidate division Zixibacteria bacterium]
MILGAHVSTAGGVQKAPLNGKKIGAAAIQMFAKNQNQWKAKPYAEETVAAFRQNLADSGISVVVIHDSYLINLCAPDPENRRKSLEAFVDELERAEALGVPYLVTHPGSHLGQGDAYGVGEVANSLNEIHAHTPGFKVMTLLETTAGQGTNLGYMLDQIAEMRERVLERSRVGVCADTAHMFAAGYDLRTEEGYEDAWRSFREIIGFEHLKAVHLNDTKKKLGSRVDRHDHIGEGELGLEPFRRLLHDPRFAGIPGILETPGEEEDYIRNLDTLRKLQ